MNESRAFTIFEKATDKQVETLDLAAAGFTSKQIARELGVAPRTVDQRIDTVRKNCGRIPRGDLVRLYRRWKEMCGSTTYDPFPHTVSKPAEAQGEPLKEVSLVFEDALSLDDRAVWDRGDFWRRPGLQPSDLGPMAKLGAVAAVALVLLMGFSLLVMSAKGVNELASSLS